MAILLCANVRNSVICRTYFPFDVLLKRRLLLGLFSAALLTAAQPSAATLQTWYVLANAVYSATCICGRAGGPALFVEEWKEAKEGELKDVFFLHSFHIS